MKRILLSAVIVLAAVAFVVTAGAATSDSSAVGTYKIEFDNAFGLVTGADFKVAGVRAGTIESIDLPPACRAGDTGACYARVTVQVTQGGFGAFRSDAFCQSRPQSLIGEYFIDCQPGQYGRVLPSGSTIPVTHTQSTIPSDLLQNVMRMPYRERLTLIINELGAAAAARSDDLQAALRRAVPAITETDNLLNLLANDSKTLQHLTVSADTVTTALARNSVQVQRFITEANNTATATATQQANLQATLQQLPGFLEQLRPTMAQLGAAADANDPVLANLNHSAAQLHLLFTQLPAFSRAAQPAIKSLGQASVTGKAAVQAAAPTVQDLNAFAQQTPELAQNLAIVLRDLEDRGRAVEPDARSPGGKGYTGLEALLQYVFDQTLAINTFGPFGHLLAVDSFVDPKCSPYATPATIALSLKQHGSSYRQCYAWLGPNQPGVNETDPSNPSACVPDPGGAPPGQTGPKTTACKLSAADLATRQDARTAAKRPATTSSPSTAATSSPTAAASIPATTSSANGPSGARAQQLLNYLLAP
jgi:virulence factor Mce-like protein